jgi:hypothetical protein
MPRRAAGLSGRYTCDIGRQSGRSVSGAVRSLLYALVMPHEPHLTRPLDPNSSGASTSSLMDIDGVVGGATLIDVERGRDQVPDSDQGASVFPRNHRFSEVSVSSFFP